MNIAVPMCYAMLYNLDEAAASRNTFRSYHNIFICFKALNSTIDNCILFI